MTDALAKFVAHQKFSFCCNKSISLTLFLRLEGSNTIETFFDKLCPLLGKRKTHTCLTTEGQMCQVMDIEMEIVFL